MNINTLHILLADDDKDDCHLFEQALKEIPISTRLTIVHDGEELMNYLTGRSSLAYESDIIFLDLSMPRKTGFECLSEIKENEKLKDIPVVVFSTSFTKDIYFEQGMINLLTKEGADNFIRKPGNFEQLKTVIQKELDVLVEKKSLNKH
jgi:CheY-like chemotaxis protein